MRCGLTIRSTGPIAAGRHLGYKSLAQMPAHRNGPVTSNVRRQNLRRCTVLSPYCQVQGIAVQRRALMAEPTVTSNLRVALISAAVTATVAILTGYFTLQVAARTGSASRSVACMTVLGARASLIRQKGEALMVAVVKSSRAIHQLPTAPDPQIGVDLDVAAAALVAYSDQPLQDASGAVSRAFANLEQAIRSNDSNLVRTQQIALKEIGLKWFPVYREQLVQLERSAEACL